jgi:hypothetical protein
MVASNVEAVMANRIAAYVVSLGCGRVMPLSGADVAGYDIPFAFCNLLLLFFSFARGALRSSFHSAGGGGGGRVWASDWTFQRSNRNVRPDGGEKCVINMKQTHLLSVSFEQQAAGKLRLQGRAGRIDLAQILVVSIIMDAILPRSEPA